MTWSTRAASSPSTPSPTPASWLIRARIWPPCSGSAAILDPAAGGSSNGKTPASGAGYRGSSPCPPASMLDSVAHEPTLGAFVTTLAGGERLETRSPELEAERAAAERGLDIERALLLVDAARAADSDVRELTDLDQRAGVRIYPVVTATSLPPVDLPGDGPRFAVLDDEVVCTADGSGWRVSRDKSDMDRARSAAEALRHAPPPVMGPSADTEELVLAEPLIRSAPLARVLAPEVCRPVGVGMRDCAPYHGWVQYMRLLDLVRSPQHRGQFFRWSLGAAARAGKQRVLVAGAADYSMLAHVLAAYEGEGRTPEATVIDRCPTPLRLCEWYARL